jgi:hypothetical protein
MVVVLAATAVGATAALARRQSTATVLPAKQATFVMTGGQKACANWGRYYVFHVGANASSVRRGLVSFDVSSIPASAQVVSATVSLYETITLRGSGVVGVHRVTTPWAEGGGQNTCVGEGATWTQTGTGSSWLTPGADFVSADESSVAKAAGDQPGWDRFDVTSTVQGWVDGAFQNDGLLLKLDDESASPCTTVTNCNYWPYASNDYSDSSLRPVLTITYR